MSLTRINSLTRVSSMPRINSLPGINTAAVRPVASRGRARRSFLVADVMRGGRLVTDVGERISLRTPASARSPAGRVSGELSAWERDKIDLYMSTYSPSVDYVLPEVESMADKALELAHDAWANASMSSMTSMTTGFVKQAAIERRLDTLRAPVTTPPPKKSYLLSPKKPSRPRRLAPIVDVALMAVETPRHRSFSLRGVFVLGLALASMQANGRRRDATRDVAFYLSSLPRRRSVSA